MEISYTPFSVEISINVTYIANAIFFFVARTNALAPKIRG
jgi:hypothetical protein